MELLVVEDDQAIASGLVYSLEEEGYGVTCCESVASASRALREKSFDLCLFDLSLPDGSGYDLCRQAKQETAAAVIFLTAADDEVNVVMGLDMGADDYITKPFRVRELQSRIKSVLRRTKGGAAAKAVVTVGDIKINTLEAKVYKCQSEVPLTALEYRLLLVFAGHVGQVLTRAQLLEGIWDVAGDFVNDNTLTVYMGRLRKKLSGGGPPIIKTVRGLGYVMEG